MRRFAVIGNPVEHSLSPIIHSAGFAALGISANYTAVQVTEDDFRKWWNSEAAKFDGFSVTMPLKALAYEVADELDHAARNIGVANTMVKRNNRWIGSNTDWLGYSRPLNAVDGLRAKRVLILGAGGAARAAVYAALHSEPLEVLVYNRTVSRLQKLRQDFPGINVITEIDDTEDIDTIINTTSVGMAELVNETPIDVKFLNPDQLVFESIYKPPETVLVQQAKHIGASTISGYELLLAQAYEQFRIFTGRDAPQQVMREAIGQ
jgi:shikimate dehydrogenase